MKIVKSSYTIEYFPNDILKKIEEFGRVCYKSEDKITDTSAEKFVKMILKSGHESVIEHLSITVRFICDRGISHEIIRHRIGSYSQESTRFCNYSKEKFDNHVSFIWPNYLKNTDYNILETNNKLILSDVTDFPLGLSKRTTSWIKSCLHSEEGYYIDLKEYGKPEESRGLLIHDLKTEIVCTYNLREWRHFFKLRTSKFAHPQMRELTIPLLQEFRKKVPVIFDDIKTKESL